MKYRFITILHNMSLEGIKNKGIQIYPGARISNGSKIMSEITDSEIFQDTAGIHSINEFNNSVYFYIDGEFKDIRSKEEMDKQGGTYTFLFLRQAQLLTHYLWTVKDHNIYVRDGFLLVYEEDFEDGFTYKASLSAIFSLSNSQRIVSSFSDKEILEAIKNFEPYTLEDYNENNFDHLKYPTSDIFFKNKGSKRISRATYFVMVARASVILPLKIVNYCMALECLFTVGSSGVSHKIAERVAVMLGVSGDSKVEFFKLVKKAYRIRSKIIHGQYLKGEDEALVFISSKLDSVLRDLIVAEHEVFSKNDSEMEEFFTNLVFN